MRVLFDHCVPYPLKRFLSGHVVQTAYEEGWASLRNGVLLNAAGIARFDVMITCDQSIKKQQNLEGRKIALIEINTNRWNSILPQFDEIIQAVNKATPGSYTEITIK